MKIKMFTKTLFTLAFALCLVKPLTADAAVIVEDSEYRYEYLFNDNFTDYILDTARYAAENPDVVAVIGNDPVVLFNHYITTGHFEGRKGYMLEKRHIDFDNYDNYVIVSDEAGTSSLRVIEFFDTHITEDMTQFQKFQIVWNYLLDENNRMDMDAGCGNNNSILLFTECLDALGIESRSIGEKWKSPQQRVWLDGIAYDIYIAWADRS